MLPWSTNSFQVHKTNLCMLPWSTHSFKVHIFMQEGNAETLQMERETEEEMRADFIAKSLG